MVTASRIDYISLRVPFDPIEKAAFCANVTDLVTECIAKVNGNPRCYRVSSYFDQGLKKPVSNFHIWGEVANEFFFRHITSFWKELSRLDYRRELDAPSVEWDTLFRLVKARNAGKHHVNMFDTPFRQKEDKRATGGTGIAIGAPDSARRTSIYQRAKEGPAFEFQFLGGEMRKWLNAILKEGLPENEPFWENHIFSKLEDEAKEVFRRHAGLSVNDLEAGISIPESLIDYTVPEQVLEQLDLLFDVLPTDAQEAFIEAHTTASPEEIADAIERVRLTAPDAWEEEPEGFWEDRHTYDA